MRPPFAAYGGFVLALLAVPASGQRDASGARLMYPSPPLAFESGGPGARDLFSARSRGHLFTFTDAGSFRVLDDGQTTLRMYLPGADPHARPEALEPLAGRVHYFTGRDPAGWSTGIATFGRIVYRSVYPDIDLVYYGVDGGIKSDLIVAPGASPAVIRLAFEGSRPPRLTVSGDLVVDTGAGVWTQHKPEIYQESDGHRRAVRGQYVLAGDGTVGLSIGPHDPNLPLVVDPAFTYSTLVGGSGDDRAYGVAYDTSGCTYIVGETWSSNLPSVPAISRRVASREVFVTKLNATGTGMVYSIYLGGGGSDSGRAIAVDSAGNAYIAGTTGSTDFPTTAGVVQNNSRGQEEAFAAKIDPQGRMVYSTLLGGSGSDQAAGIAVNTAGEAFVAGYTSSYDFPTTAAAQSAFGGGFFDIFVTRLNAYGTARLYSTYFGGSGNDGATAIALDATGNAHITGYSDSANFPCLRSLRNGTVTGIDSFVLKLDLAGRVTYATSIGGSGTDLATGIAVDSSGAATIAGSTSSTDFPVRFGGYQTVNRGAYDGFIARLSPSGAEIALATYLGGTGTDEVRALALDSRGAAYVVGATTSIDFPQLNDAGSGNRGGRDAFLAILSASGTALEYSRLLSGSGDDDAQSVAVDRAGRTYVAGYTLSPNFPTSAGVIGPALAGSTDAFVIKLGFNLAPEAVSVSPSSGSGLTQPFTFTFSDPNGTPDLVWLFVVINSGYDGGNACYFAYHQPSNAVFLFNDAASAATSVSMGGTAVLQNSQCSLQGTSASITSSGNSLLFRVSLTFKPAFAGDKNIYLTAYDTAGAASGVLSGGTWRILRNEPPLTISATPNSGTGSSQTFNFTFSDPNGYSDLTWSFIVISGSFNGVNACYLGYHQASNAVFLFNDAGNSATAVPLGASAVAQNSQCSLDGRAASVSASGETLTLKLPLSFKPAFAGAKTVYLFAIDGAGSGSAVGARGTWVVPANHAPVAVSVVPNAGTAASQTFTFAASDPNGYGDLAWVFVFFSPLGSGNLCHFGYHRPSNTVYLFSDDLQTASWASIPGSVAVQNSQCAIQAAGSSVSTAGDTLTLRLAISFKPSFAGPKQVLLYALDSTLMSSPMIGTSWTVP